MKSAKKAKGKLHKACERTSETREQTLHRQEHNGMRMASPRESRDSDRFLSQITLCFSFGSKDMITVLTCLPSYRYSSFTPRAYDGWRHTYCQSIIELVSPKNKMASSYVVQIHTHTHFPRSKKWPTYHVTVCRTNSKRSSFSMKHFQRKSLKIFDLHPPLRRLVSFVAQIIM